jgi:hypothetical protein
MTEDPRGAVIGSEPASPTKGGNVGCKYCAPGDAKGDGYQWGALENVPTVHANVVLLTLAAPILHVNFNAFFYAWKEFLLCIYTIFFKNAE